MKSRLFILLLSLAFNTLKGQADSARLAKSAIEITKLDSLSEVIYDALHPYKLIMIGEMHGTQEPATFVKGLAELFTKHNDSVVVGFEIPSDQMKLFIKMKNERAVYNSDFFKFGSTDGIANDALASCIASVSKNPRVRILFYDINSGESKKNNNDRDSLMYLKIKNELKKHPASTFITLSGNIHNMLLAYKGENKVAGYLSKDNDLHIADKICSLNHVFKSGTMLNNMGKGLQLNKVDNGVTEYSKFTKYNNYLFLFPSKQYAYNGVFYTRNVTAAKLTGKEPVKEKYMLQETFNKMDVPTNDYLTQKLKPIRENFKRINSISEWDSLQTKIIAPSVKVKFYYTDKKLQKIVNRSGQGINQELIEYYLLKGELSFVYEKYFEKEGDLEKPEIVETKYYFEKGKLLNMINSHDRGASFAADYLLNEEKRVKKQFEQLVKFKN
jgi:hypothetical protein